MAIERLLRLAFLGIAVQGVGGYAKDTPANWKSECVGRMQIELPGEAEVAAQTAVSWVLEDGGNGQPTPRFTDGQMAGWTRTKPFKISHPLTAAEMSASFKHSELTSKKFARYAKASDWNQKSFRSIRTPQWAGVTWSFTGKPGPYARYDQSFLVKVDQHLVEWSWSEPDAEAARLEQRVNTLLKDLSPRTAHLVPVEVGLCYPYMFVKDDGLAKREVAMTYRLKDHPDITVTLEDKSAPPHLKNEGSRYRTAKYASDSHWARVARTDETFVSLWYDRYQRTTLAGYDGVESYVEIKRADGTIDYSYYVSVRGDSEAKEDEPDMTFWITRNSSVAKAKGVQPYGDEKTFLALAKSIAGSVKRRPTR